MISPASPKLALLQEAITAALSGDKRAARTLLEQVTSAYPESELAWLWLASVSVTPQETMRCWRRVYKINPHQEQALDGLKRLLLQEGVNAARDHRKQEARELLLELTQLDALHEVAWLWLATLATDIEEAAQYTARVLHINPQNERAQAWMERLRPPIVPPDSLDAAEPLNMQASSGWSCPLCLHETIRAATHCPQCQAVVSLTSLDEILNNQAVNLPLLQAAVRRLEEQAEAEGEHAEYDTLFSLGLGYLNLQRLGAGTKCLRRASELKLKDTRLKAQVESLLARMCESASASEMTLTAVTPTVTAIAEAAPLPPPEAFGAYTILVVDDSPTIRKLVTMTLEKYGHHVLSATNGLDALNRLKEVVPDLILSDINMPHMDGYQLCKMIRGNSVTRSVPVIMLSGKDGIFDKLRGRMVGATAYITKPFEIDSLLQLIDMHCQQAQRI